MLNQNQGQYTTTRVRPQLREQAIATADLMEVDSEQLKEAQQRGMTLNQLKQALDRKREEQSIAFDVAFIPPKKEKFAKKGVFLPEKDQRYADLRSKVKKNLLQKFRPQGQTVQVQNSPGFTFVNQPKVVAQGGYQQLPRQTYTSYQNNNYPQTYTSNTNVQRAPVIRRVLQKSDGQIVQLDPNRQYM